MKPYAKVNMDFYLAFSVKERARDRKKQEKAGGWEENDRHIQLSYFMGPVGPLLLLFMVTVPVLLKLWSLS